MKTRWFLGIGLLALILVGCTKEKVVVAPDTEPPASPRGVRSITGDGKVTIQWYPNGERDLDGYRVWKSFDSLAGPYQAISGILTGTSYVDRGVVNGVTYFYAVTALDHAGNESALSKDDVFDTPRPEGLNFSISDFNHFGSSAGFDLSAGLVVPYTSLAADFYLEFNVTDNTWFINAANASTNLQDMGYTSSMDDISFAPNSGWSKVGWTEALVGHTYVIWTADNHYAKVRITGLGNPTLPGAVLFDWAYQPSSSQLGRPELKPVAPPQHDPSTYLRRSIPR